MGSEPILEEGDSEQVKRRELALRRSEVRRSSKSSRIINMEEHEGGENYKMERKTIQKK